MPTLTPFSQAVRERTRAIHTETEGSAFVAELIDGKRSKDDYAALLGQLYFVYQALEQVAATLRGDPVASHFVDDKLTRLPAIAADLDFLIGRDWRDTITPLRATQRYAQRIHEMVTWSGGFVAHHYTRYLGDLSGGQVIRTVLQRQHGFDTNGVGFYIFAEIAKPKLFRDTYREQLDTAPWDEAEQERVIAEVTRAFELNGALFDDLAEGHQPRCLTVTVTQAPTETAGIAAEQRPPSHRRTVLLFLILTIVLVVAMLVSAMIGQVPISPTEVIGSILQHAGIPNGWAPHDRITDATLWVVRFPRVLMAVVVGAALAVAGSVMQAIFGNPLAEPGVVGVSSGAALGAALAIVLGVTALGGWSTAVFAFVGGFGAVLLVYVVSRSRGRTEVVTLILTGIAMNAFAGAGIAFLVFAADKASREQIVFWQLGSLNGSLGSEAGIVAIVAVLGTAVAVGLAPRYDLLALGERNARHLGVNVEGLRIVSIVLVALLTGAAVAFCGIIAFVGLVIPHIIRMMNGPRHRPLVIGSAFGGASLVVMADLLARTLVWGADLPIGMLTSLIGGPFFFFLLIRQRRASGGWG